jgi:photosystem II stability/assembly factor-like uncharacterized protein
MAKPLADRNDFKAVAVHVKEPATAATGLFFTEPMVGNTCQKVAEKVPNASVNLVFRSTDSGQTWQDVSAELPEGLLVECMYANDSEVFLGTENGLYHSKSGLSVPVWEKDFSLDKEIWGVFPGRAGCYARMNRHGLLQQVQGSGLWVPVFAELKNKAFRTIFEAADGAVFIGCDDGLFKSADHGKTWKHVHNDGWVIRMAESNGVLICTNQRGILRSADGGEHWEVVVSEGGVGIAAEVIEGGFAVITYNTESETRRVRISNDAGKTWQAIDALLPPSPNIASIKQVGKYFFCGHPKGIYRSADKGKSWQLMLPSVWEKVFNLSVSGKVIYAVPQNSGC